MVAAGRAEYQNLTERSRTESERMIQAGITPITWLAVLCEWQRDWARAEKLGDLATILQEHGGSSGVAFDWEMQLLGVAG